MPDRVEPKEKFTTMEQLVAILVGRGLEYPEIATRLSILKSTVKFHAEKASAKLPGTDAPRMKLQLWWRGATREVMEPPSER
jgi:DNA-binding NarL/FixJ family response regulator